MALGEGAPAVAELMSLPVSGPAAPLSAELRHYWLGLAYLLAFEWGAAAHELRSFLAGGDSSWRAGWAYLHLGRAYQQAGRMDEASLAFRGCLSVADAEKPARQMAFELMSRLANSVPIGYGQAPTRPASR